MGQAEQLVFGPFRLDPVQKRLWRGTQAIALQPQPLAVLHYLVTHVGRVVPAEELLKQVWAGTHVTKTALKVCIRAIRVALGDEATAARYVETVGRRGYRFIGPLPSLQFVAPSSPPILNPLPPLRLPQSAIHIVGRDATLAQIHRILGQAETGRRQVMFLTGEAGIGKTTVVEVFLQQVQMAGQVWIGRGQCLEQYGEGEAYLPVLEALGQLARGPEGEQIIERLRQYAPTWLAQMPALLNEMELEALQRKVSGATRERMLREMAETLEALTTLRGLVLVFEDLHWSDRSTLDLIAYVGQRQERARVLMIGTYRPAELVAREHPLKAITQVLQQHRQCEEVQLELLTKSDINEYLTQRFGGQGEFTELAAHIHQRTDGNPLFMITLVEAYQRQGLGVHGRWTQQGRGASENVPEGLQRMIEQQITRLRKDERQVLEGASVVGAEFAVAAVAAVLRREPDVIEEVCEELAHAGLFLRETGIAEWPDGTVSGRYGFRHTLYQQVLYQRIAAARRVRMHRQIGERIEQGYKRRGEEIAAVLAVHFERGRDHLRAAQYHEHAARNALRRSAPQEAITHLDKGLALLATQPETPERAQQELTLYVTLGPALIAAKGNGAPEVETAYMRARERCEQVGDTPRLFPVLFGLRSCYLVRGEIGEAHTLGEQLLTLARRGRDPGLLLEAHVALGNTFFLRGELIAAQTHLEQGETLYDHRAHSTHTALYGLDPLAFCRSRGAWTLWLLGYPDQAQEVLRTALVAAEQLAHPFSSVVTLLGAASLHLAWQEIATACHQAAQAIAIATEHQFPALAAMGAIYRDRALVAQEGGQERIAHMRQGVAALHATGAALFDPYVLALLAEAYSDIGQSEEGLKAVIEALAIAQKTGERFYEAELYRLKGELLLQSMLLAEQALAKMSPDRGRSERRKVESYRPEAAALPSTRLALCQAEGEECFQQAIAVARQQEAKSWELRATMNLCRLWEKHEKRSEARKKLTEIYSWFKEGFATKDLRDAQALLDKLA